MLTRSSKRIFNPMRHTCIYLVIIEKKQSIISTCCKMVPSYFLYTLPTFLFYYPAFHGSLRKFDVILFFKLKGIWSKWQLSYWLCNKRKSVNLVHNQKENFRYEHFPSDLKGIANRFCVWMLPDFHLYLLWLPDHTINHTISYNKTIQFHTIKLFNSTQ